MIEVVAGLLMRDGKALLGLRKAGGKRGGLWEMPGGKCDIVNTSPRPHIKRAYVESHETALRREWMEELSLDIVVGARIATCFLDLEVSFTVTLYEVHTAGTPKTLDHDELRWVEPGHAIVRMPCSPALYLHWPVLRAWLATQDNVPTLPFVPRLRNTRTLVVDGEPKTTDYCVKCGESPESGSHLPHGHAYVDPRYNAIATVSAQPYRCNVPMCGESGVCEECRKRGAR